MVNPTIKLDLDPREQNEQSEFISLERTLGIVIPDHFLIPGFRDWKTPIPGFNLRIETACKSGSIVGLTLGL